MPWCPVCHAEYRAGVKVCRQCQAELVRTPPRPGEHYEPPAESMLDTMAEALTQRLRGRGWSQQIASGFGLFSESFRLMRRMRNLWLLLLVLTIPTTVAVLRPSRPIDASTLAMSREVMAPYPPEVMQHVAGMWRTPMTAVSHVSQDLRTGLSTPFRYVSWLYGWLYLRTHKDATAPPPWYAPATLGGVLVILLIETLFTAGLLWCVLATIRGEAQTAARFWEGVRRAFWPLLAWALVFTIIYQGLYTIALGRGAPPALREAFLALLALAVLPLTFTSKVIVVRRPPLYWAPVDSVRIFAKSLLVVLGFAIPFIVVHDLIWALDASLRYYYYSVSDPHYALRYAMPALAFVMQMLKVAVELLITTASVILVARWKEADEAEPAHPEAASA
jgi:hypothetical protein